MKLSILLFFCCLNCFCQNAIVKNVTKLVGIDIYENCYYLQDDALHKSGLKNDYKNIEFGAPNVIDISNPLQVLLLYKFFNKVVFLDDQLSFITQFEVPIGTSLIANASKDKIWIYDSINMRIKLYNFKTHKIEISSIPITKNILELRGNLNKALTLNNQNELIEYNFLARRKGAITDTKNMLLPLSLIENYFIKENILYKKSNQILPVNDSIKSFEVINDKLYFFKKNTIYKLSIPKN